MMETRVFRRTRKTMKGISNERFNRDPQVPAEGGGLGGKETATSKMSTYNGAKYPLGTTSFPPPPF